MIMKILIKNKLNYLLFAIFIASANLLSGCYTLNGFSIDPDVNSFYVKEFVNNAENSLVTIGQSFSEVFRKKIRTDTRLFNDNTNPDIEFEGEITTFRVTSEAPQTGEQIAFNRLTIGVQVDYIHNKDESKNWQKKYSRFADFGSDENLLDVQDNLVTEISEQIVVDIFNDAFNDW